MKKWNNPELLNLMVQETKTVEEKNKLYHECKSTGDKCSGLNNWKDDPDTCLDNHKGLKYNWLTGTLNSCCNTTDNPPVTMS